MATYNGEKYIQEQIESILSQLGKHDEVVVSDDGSNDRTIELIQSYSDNRIVLLSNHGKHGYVGNFENALRHAKGDYIFLSDQDDIWLPGKVEKVISALSDNDIAIHDAQLVNGDGISLGNTYYSTLHTGTSFWANFWKNRWLGCCMAFKREVCNYCLPFPNGIVAHDYWIGMMGMTKFKYCFMDDVLLKYRRHGGNVSPSSEKSNNSLYYKLFTKRLFLLFAVVRCKLFRNNSFLSSNKTC